MLDKFPIIILNLWCSSCSSIEPHILTTWLYWACLGCRAKGRASIRASGDHYHQDFYSEGA